MKYIFLFLVAFFLIMCRDECSDEIVKPYNREEILIVHGTSEPKTRRQDIVHDLSEKKIMDLMRYLVSVDAFDEMGELSFTNPFGETYYIPYALPPQIKEGYIEKDDILKLSQLICLKQPAVPTMNFKASSPPKRLSTIGIEAMHLINYAYGNEAAYVSNVDFCPNEKQDSMVQVIRERYKL